MGFQTTAAASTFAPAVAGDFADHNPRVNISAGPGGIVAGPSGVFVGRFCWLTYGFLDPDNAAQVSNSFGAGPVAGFVANVTQGLNTTYLSDATMIIRSGLMQSATFSQGGFWVVNSGTNEVVPEMVAYANFANGLVTFAAASSATTGTVATSAIAAGTFSGFTGSLSGNILTITAAGTGSIYPGATLTAGGAATGTKITSQLSSSATGGALGTTGVYSVSIPEQAIAANSSWGGTYGILTLGATPSATVPLGAVLTGTGISATTTVGAYIAGAGTANGNTLAVDVNTVVASTTLTFTTNIATKWVARSGGGAGSLIKMSTWLQG